MKKNRRKKIKETVANKQEGIIVLEDPYDPHNATAVMRTAEGFGFQKVWLVFCEQSPFDPKQIGKKSSGSANKWLDFEIFESIDECYKKLKEDGYQIWATVLDKKSKKLAKTKFKKGKIALVFGNEHAGLSSKAVKLADKKIYIEMKGLVQSLNLSVTAGIVMWEVTRQRQGKFKLGKEEKKELVNCLLKRS